MTTLIPKYDQGSTGAVNRAINLKLAETISILDFGADPTGANDSTSAIQNAINSGAGSLYFPTGTYLVTSLNVVSNQNWYGDGQYITTLKWVQTNISTTTQNMLNSTSDLANWSIQDIGLLGNLAVQTSPDSTGQNLCGIKFRAGSLQNIRFERIYVRQFGDQTKASGAGALLGPTSGTGKVLSNIRFLSCTFESIARVPGIYINANNATTTSANGVLIQNCIFNNNTNYATQNCIFVLTLGTGAAAILFTNVIIQNNIFNIPNTIDTCIELNDCNGFTISGNEINVTGTANCTGVLIRSNTRVGEISNNSINNNGTGCSSSTAISLVPFASDSESNIDIIGNSIVNFGQYGIQLTAVAQVNVTGNTIVNNQGTPTGIQIANASNLEVSSNYLYGCFQAFILGAGTNGLLNIVISNNTMVSCGSSGNPLIASVTTSENMTYLVIRNNVAQSVVSGSTYFVSVSTSASTGNRLENNVLPSTLTLLNPSYATNFVGQITPAVGIGQLSLITSGTTANRPTSSAIVGQSYYDTSLGIPIWYSGSSTWKNASGSTV